MPYIKTESDRVIAWVDDDYKDFDSLEEYINDCDLCERPLEVEKLTKEQKEKVKQSVKEYFENHPELKVPKNEESGLPFWEDDFMMTHSED